MTTRGFTPAELAAAAARASQTTQLIEVRFDSGTLRLAVGRLPVRVGSTTYWPAKTLAMEATTENAASLEGFRFAISGLDMDAIAIAAGEPYYRRPVLLYEAWLDADLQAVAPPRIEWMGRLTALAIEETQRNATISGQVEHFAAEEGVPRNDYYNGASQARRHPGDTGLNLVEQMSEITLVWPSKEALKK